MRFVDRPRPAQIYVGSICALALQQAALAARQPTPHPAPTSLFLLLALAAAIAHSFPVSTPGKQPYHVSLPLFVVAITLLSPLQFIALIGIVQVVEGLRVRRSTSVPVFNGAVLALGGLVAQGVFHGLWTADPNAPVDLTQAACLAAGLAAATIFALVNRVLVSIAIWFGNGIPPREQRTFDIEGLLTDGVLLLMGVPLAHLLWIAPWAALAGAAPIWLIHRALDLPHLRGQSRQDGLTELFTAPYLTETCTRELNRAARFNRSVTLLLLDVDALGELNAAHGQQTGDVVLRATARTISKALREYDLAARLAGGLFAVLLPETDLAQAQVVAERVRRETAELRHEVPGNVEQARVTISIGAAIVNGQTVTAAQMFDAARSALAHAKHDGGNEIAFQTISARAPASAQTPIALAPSHASASIEHATDRSTARRGTRSVVAAWLRAHAHTLAVCALGSVGLGICLVGLIADLDWPLLAVLLSLAALAAFIFNFRSLALALALAAELNRSPARLVLARYWRMWPRYVALGAGAWLAAYAYTRLGLAAALGIGCFGLLVRYLSGRYVDRTLDGVRKLRNANESLEHQAFHDPLTNLPNRALFAERLEHAMVRAGEGSVAVLFIDLDNFKSVNDTLGHAAGDALLIAATDRLVQCVRREDTVARLGGDEFTVLLEDLHDPSDAARMAERICTALAESFDLDGQQASVSSSIGIALDTDRSHAPDDLMREADLAMYRAKSGGKARYEIFDTYMAERAMHRLGLETELRQAIELGQMRVAYRRLLAAGSEEVVALQAVPRWQHPRYGLLEAREFQRLAEDTGAVLDIGRWVLEQACHDARQWQPRHPGVRLSVRLSPRQLEDPQLVNSVHHALAASSLSPSLLCLDVPEASAAISLGALRAAGVKLALDDVGASPLALQALAGAPFDSLRLHQTVLDSADLLRATSAIGVALGMSVTVPSDTPAELEHISNPLEATFAQRAA